MVDSRGEKTNNHKELEELYRRFCDAGQLTPNMAIRIIIQTLGGSRISIPTFKYLERKARNERIRQLFHGGNYRELAARFGVSERRVRAIVHGRNNS